ncbi:MAG: ATP-binding cassette domain-containing protein [Acidobacteriota bacterium]
MSLLHTSGLAFRHDSQADWLFQNVSFDLGPGDRVALVGPNGSGKTSLLRIVAGELEPVVGALVRRSGLRVACVLEVYLAGIDAACLLISHDRVFLNRTTTRTFELRGGSLTAYAGSYDDYREQRELAERQAWKKFEAQQSRAAAARRAAEQRVRTAAKVARAPEGVRNGHDFYRAKAARLQRTARILRERVTHEPRAVKPFFETAIPVLDFADVHRSGNTLLRIDGLSKSFEGKPLFRGLSMTVGRGERWALLGPNGSGKTTLLRIVRGLERADEGTVEMGIGARLGYFSQEGEHIDPEMSPLAFCLAVNPDETRVRTILGCLKVRADQVRQPIGSMSGGERAKVALAALLVGEANLLLLDEPTNHLDIEAREALEATLAQYPGAILFVSHDRRFVESLAEDRIDLSRAC